MASFTINTAPWPAGTTVSVFPARAWVAPPAQPSGTPVATGVVTTAGVVTVTGLADQEQYVAYAAGTGVRFTVAAAGLQRSVAIPDRERITALETQPGGTGGTSGALIINVGAPLPDTSYPDGTLLVILGTA